MFPDSRLTAAEQAELHAFLLPGLEELTDDAGADAGPLDLTGLHGLQTAVASGPQAVLPTEWLPLIWGAGPPPFTDEEQARRILSLIMRQMNEIVSALMDDPDAFSPLMITRGTSKRNREYAGAWCRGYMRGVLLRVQDWHPFIEDPTIKHALAVIATGSMDLPRLRLPKGITPRDLHGDLCDAAVEIHRFFLKRRTPRIPTVRETARVGRNELCPCGSGKKYKRCCGA